MRQVMMLVAIVVLVMVDGCGKKPPAGELALTDKPAIETTESIVPVINQWSSQNFDAPQGAVNSVRVEIGWTTEGATPSSDGETDALPWGKAHFSDDAGHTVKDVLLPIGQIVDINPNFQKPLISPNGSYVAIWSGDGAANHMSSPVGIFETHTGRLVRKIDNGLQKHEVRFDGSYKAVVDGQTYELKNTH